jgi:viroplasmin and RNaseH domain-containing protein
MIYSYFINENCYGYVDSWELCRKITSGVPGAKYKKFKDKAEASLYLKSLIKK